MGEEYRNSSGSTAMIVVAILGGILLLVCCGGVVVVAGGVLFYRSARNVEAEMQRSSQEMRDIGEEMHREMNVPADPPDVPPAEIAPAPAPAVIEDKQE